MKQLFLSILCFFCCTQSNAAANILVPSPCPPAGTNAFFTAQVSNFYEQYICQAKQLLATAGLTTPCIGENLQAPPANPSAPPFMGNLLPVVLVNNSGISNRNVFILVTGRDENDPQTEIFISFDSSGVGTPVVATNGDDGYSYTKSLLSFPATQDGHVIYLPKIIDGLIWFSFNQLLSLPVDEQNHIIKPDGSNSRDINYNKVFDKFALNYSSSSIEVIASATAIDFFGFPLYGYLSTPASDSNQHTGLFNARRTIFNAYATAISDLTIPPANNQWCQLVLNNGTVLLRLLSTGKAMAADIFDPNYLDNTAYDNTITGGTGQAFTYIRDIWTGSNSFYRQHPLIITIPEGSQETYTGVINPNNTITFTSAPSGYKVILSEPSVAPLKTTSRKIFQGEFFILSDNSPGMLDGAQINAFFEAAIITGLAPTASTLSETYFTHNQSNFYANNPNLSTTGQNSGPWYDLYSKVLHEQGFIYTYAFDELIWPQVPIFAQTFVPNQTYLGITIGDVSSTI